MVESSIKSIMLLAKTEMAEPGLAGRFSGWYSATDFGRAYRDATYKQRLGTTPHAKMFRVKKDVSKFRPSRCRAYLHLNKERQEPGKHAPRAVEAIHLGFASDMSCHKFWVLSTSQLVHINQAKYDEDLSPYRNKEMIEGRLAEDSDMDILSQEIPEVKWIQYTPATTTQCA